MGEGPPVVLLHGLPCHLGYWLRVIPLLGGARVVAFDFRGHGLAKHADSYRYADTNASSSRCSIGSSSTGRRSWGTRSAGTSPCSRQAAATGSAGSSPSTSRATGP